MKEGMNIAQINEKWKKVKVLERILEEDEENFVMNICKELGYTYYDAREMIRISRLYLNRLREFYEKWLSCKAHKQPFIIGENYFGRTIHTSHKPKGKVLIFLPANAPFPLGIITCTTALLLGNHVILKPSKKTKMLGRILGFLFKKGGFSSQFRVLEEEGKEILEKNVKEVDLIHFIGSSKHLKEVRKTCAEYFKEFIGEGEGNGIIIVDKNFPINLAVDIITKGALRCNGLLCTKIFGALIHREVYKKAKILLVKKFSQLKYGDPLDKSVDIGPILFSDLRRRIRYQLQRIIRKGAVVLSRSKGRGVFIPPTLLEIRKNDIAYIPGPILWIKKFSSFEEIKKFINHNSGLVFTILTSNPDFIESIFENKVVAPYIVVNNDPTLQSPFSPWGGLKKAGNKGPLLWFDKYTTSVVIDKSFFLSKNHVKACVIEGIRKLSIKKFPFPDVEKGFIVKMVVSGICGTDKAIFSGQLPVNFPIIPGHENVGVIVNYHSKSKNDEVGEGDLVTWPAIIPCGKCKYCADGNENQCERGRVFGISYTCDIAPYLFGGWGEYAYLPSEVKFFKIKKKKNILQFILAEPFACTHIIEKVAEKGEKICVIGSGTLAILSAIRGRMLKCKVLMIMKKKLYENKKEIIRRAVKNIYFKEEYGHEMEILFETDGEGVDIVIDAAGTQSALETAINIVKKKGTIVELGGFGKPKTVVDLHKLTKKEICIVSSVGYNVNEFMNSCKKANKLKFLTKLLSPVQFEESKIKDALLDKKSTIKSVIIF